MLVADWCCVLFGVCSCCCVLRLVCGLPWFVLWCLLFAVVYDCAWLLRVRCLLFVGCFFLCLLCPNCCVRRVVRSVLLGVWCFVWLRLVVGGCSLWFAVCCLLFVVCSLLFVGCCLLCAVC